MLRQKPQAGCWFYASEGVRLSLTLFIQPLLPTSVGHFVPADAEWAEQVCGGGSAEPLPLLLGIEGGGGGLFCEDSEWNM